MWSIQTSRSACLLVALALSAGCTGQEYSAGSPPDVYEPEILIPTEPPQVTGDTATDTETEDQPDCSGAVTDFTPVFGPGQSYDHFIYTGTDFDFDFYGRLVTPLGQQLVAFDADGTVTYINHILGDAPLGIRSLPTGDIVMAMPDLGSLRMLNADTGDLQTVLGGMVHPYALEVSSEGLVYASEYAANGRIFELDVESGMARPILEASYVLGLALSSDEQTLYLSSTTDEQSEVGRITAIDRDASGDWSSEPRFVYGNGYRVDAITSDACGFLYVGGWNGRVVRIRQADDAVEQLVDLPSWRLTSARFGNSIGDFSHTQLFLSDGGQLFTLELGLDGRNVLTP